MVFLSDGCAYVYLGWIFDWNVDHNYRIRKASRLCGWLCAVRGWTIQQKIVGTSSNRSGIIFFCGYRKAKSSYCTSLDTSYSNILGHSTILKFWYEANLVVMMNIDLGWLSLSGCLYFIFALYYAWRHPYSKDCNLYNKVEPTHNFKWSN